MDPTDSERAGFTDLSKVASWVGFTDDGTDALQPWGSLSAHLGVGRTAAVRIVGYIPAADFETLVNGWTINSTPPTPAQRSQAGLLGRACRVTIGLEKDLATAKMEADRQYAIDLAKAKASASASHTSSSQKRFKHSNWIDQADDAEEARLDKKTIEDMYRVYHGKMGAPPKPDEELTAEQLSALHNVAIRDSGTPYVDMAVWGPHGYRVQKKLRLKGVKIGPDGQITSTEIPGPMSFDVWSECWRLFRTGALMLSLLELATVEAYIDKIREYSQRYGHNLWLLIYQADVRARQEHWERCRRKGAEEHYKAGVKGQSHEYDPNMPWEWALKDLIDDDKFWKREIEDEAILILAKQKSMVDSIGEESQGGRKRQSLAQSPPVPEDKRVKMHNIDKEGFALSNRRGRTLCKGWQDGSCTETGRDNRCGKNSSEMHQCSKCLSTEHGRSGCGGQFAKMPTKTAKGKKGKGKGGRH